MSTPKMLLCVPLSVVFFFVVCLCSASTVKRAALILVALTFVLVLLCFSKLRSRVTVPFIALALYVLMNGMSTLYATSGKFALYEFLKILCAFCLTMIVLAVAPGPGMESGRWIASILEGFVALAALISIDMISTHYISDLILFILSKITPDYLELEPLVPGTRINSIFTNPNVFAGIAGIGVMLSLGLVLSSAGRKERAVHTSCLAVTSLAFVLAFSMGGSGTIALAFLVYLALESRERRPHLFLLMAETLVVTLLSAMVISTTSFNAWVAQRPIPLACAVLNAAVLPAMEVGINGRLSNKLRGHGRIAAMFLGGAAAAVAVYAVLAFQLTGPASLEPGEYLFRSIYPEPGEYTVDIQADGPVSVQIYCYDKEGIVLERSTALYRGVALEAKFTVPERSEVVYFRMTSDQPVNIDRISCSSVEETIEVPLRYRLLPGFMANRIQGLFANHSVMERLVFFEDGMKLFKKSPVIGLGLGAFESGLKSVQSYYYETKYLHNHYLQTLLDTGIIGLLLFVGIFVACGVSIWRARKKDGFDPMISALGGALMFMAAHGGAEVDFSMYSYLPVAFVTFGLIGLCTQDAMPRVDKERAIQTGATLGISALMAVFGLLLVGNMQAAALAAQKPTMDDLAKAAKLDKFEWADYMLAYVVSSVDDQIEDETRIQAEQYAERLSKVDSNSIPFYLADYYLTLGRIESGMRMLEKYTDYTASDSTTWQNAFDLLEWHKKDTEQFRAEVERLAARMDAWNEEHLGTVVLSEKNLAFLERIRG
ncbi:MAG: O-antigen ligase family protein [Lawsonibacter sp.]|jgi:hypothetical protein|nr:O-antigen ligase family protein [Lawsonibacter sp.]